MSDSEYMGNSAVIDRIEAETARYMELLPYLEVITREELDILHGRLEDLYIDLRENEPDEANDVREDWEGLREDLDELLDAVLRRMTKIDKLLHRE